ncbi:MAG: 1-deoxy-D-xylulose-5-phosphate reductoisomerase [Gammaproteobacteria bacterium]|nr:1-deoxy-D-xylulose-5-phosphate reductoisomerase [Gammaproteobacteria bacterium]
MKGITILGATGSIGLSTLNVLEQHPDKYQLIALTADKNVERLYEQCLTWHPKYAVMADEESADKLRDLLSNQDADIEVLAGEEGLITVASLPETDYVMAAIVGAAGLLPTLAAARAGKRVLLANKESLVMSGQLFMDAIHENGAELLPIDSEHNAIFQCLPTSLDHSLNNMGITRILITASGGPFRCTPIKELSAVTPEQACDHPNWNMGKKISVDSATMMNKGLEIIEACWLFNAKPEQLQVVIHPQSVIHSMVEYEDGSILAQLGNPDMRTPIAHALAWPERISSGVKSLDLFDIARLDFEYADYQRFPCLKLAADAMHAGGTSTTILNAANEIAVFRFLQGRIRFTDIAKIVEMTLTSIQSSNANTIECVLDADKSARQYSEQLAGELAA